MTTLQAQDPRTAPRMLAALHSGEMDGEQAERCIMHLADQIATAEGVGDFDSGATLRAAMTEIQGKYPVRVVLPKVTRPAEPPDKDGQPATVPADMFQQVSDELQKARLSIAALEVENEQLRAKLAAHETKAAIPGIIDALATEVGADVAKRTATDGAEAPAEQPTPDLRQGIGKKPSGK